MWTLRQNCIEWQPCHSAAMGTRPAQHTGSTDRAGRLTQHQGQRFNSLLQRRVLIIITARKVLDSGGNSEKRRGWRRHQLTGSGPMAVDWLLSVDLRLEVSGQKEAQLSRTHSKQWMPMSKGMQTIGTEALLSRNAIGWRTIDVLEVPSMQEITRITKKLWTTFPPWETIKTPHLSERQKNNTARSPWWKYEREQRETHTPKSYFHLIKTLSASVCWTDSINMSWTQMYPDSEKLAEMPPKDFIHFKMFLLVVKILDTYLENEVL